MQTNFYKPRIILFAGSAQHGKDASASIMKGYLEQFGKKCLIIRYGDVLKFIALTYFNWNGKKDKEGRTILQKLGTEEARDHNPDIWANIVIEIIKGLGHMFDYILISDFRYPNEHKRWVEEGYETTTIFIHRKDFDNGLTEEQKQHRSETSLLDYNFDHMISSESGIGLLSEKIIPITKKILS